MSIERGMDESDGSKEKRKLEDKVMYITCLDMEGVLVPEIWIAFAEASGIPELKKTTRDEPDYDKLMQYRLDILKEHGLGLKEIQETIAKIDPMPGAKEFLDELRSFCQVIILSDTFEQFATPQELADFAVECYRTGEREKLLPHMTEAGARKLREELATEEQMKADKAYARSLAEMREALANSTYTCRGEESLGAQNKQYSYKSKPSGYNLRVLLEAEGGEWKVDLVGPGR